MKRLIKWLLVRWRTWRGYRVVERVDVDRCVVVLDDGSEITLGLLTLDRFEVGMRVFVGKGVKVWIE